MLFQMTEMVPSSLAGRGNDVIDARKTMQPSCKVNGNSPVLAYEFTIYKNTIASEKVYTTNKKTLSEPFYPTTFDGKQNLFKIDISNTTGMVNGYADGYKSVWKFWYSATEFVEQYSASFFIARGTPTLTINPYTQPLKQREITITATYSQSENTPLEWFRFILVNDAEKENIVFDTGIIYGAKEIKMVYDELFTGITYFVKCVGETQDGFGIETPWKEIVVSYPLDEIEGILEVCQSKNSCSNTLNWARLRIINGEPLNNNYSYMNNIPVVGHNSINIANGNNISFNKVTGLPMLLPVDLNYIWSGTIEKSNANIIEIDGDNHDLDLFYYETEESGLLCEVNTKTDQKEAQMIQDTSIIFGVFTNANYRFLTNTPSGTTNTSIELDAGNFISFNKSNGLPLKLEGNLIYTYSGMPKGNNVSLFKVTGRDENNINHNIEFTYKQKQSTSSGIYAGATSDKLQNFLYDIIKGTSSVAGGYSYLKNYPVGSNQNSIQINQSNKIVFNSGNGQSMPNVSNTKSIVWCGKIQTNNSTIFEIICINSSGQKNSLLFQYSEKIRNIGGAKYPSKKLYPAKGLYPMGDLYEWVASISVSIAGSLLFRKDYAQYGHNPKGNILDEAFVKLIIMDNQVILKWDNGVQKEVISIFHSSIASYLVGIEEVRLFGKQICEYVWISKERLAQSYVDKVLDEITFTPSNVYNSQTTFLCEFNGDQYLSVGELTMTYDANTIMSQHWIGKFTDNAIDINNQMVLDYWIHLVSRHSGFNMGLYKDGQNKPIQTLTESYNKIGNFGDTIEFKMGGKQRADYIGVSHTMGTILMSDIINSLSYEPKVDKNFAFLCKFKGISNLRYGFIELKLDNTKISGTTLVADKESVPANQLLSDGWWTIAIEKEKINLNWYKNTFFYSENRDVFKQPLPQFGTKAIRLMGNQKCDYLLVTNGVLTQDELDKIGGKDLTYEPEYLPSTQILARFNNSLGAGNVFTEFDSITGVTLYRNDLINNSTHYLSKKSLQDTQAIDYACVSQQEYQYLLYPVGNLTFGSPIKSENITTLYWDWCLLDCEEIGTNQYLINKEYLYKYNVESDLTSISVVNSVSNFTKYNTYQTGTQNYFSGTLTGLMGFFDQKTKIFHTHMNEMDQISALKNSYSTKFLKDREGHLWKIKLMAQIKFTTWDKTREQCHNINFSWEECGSAENVSIMNRS